MSDSNNTAERKPISKKMRFEVFKRDSFTCQYCGRHAPDVVLECDHINPVANGGKNTIFNLITACMECNRGKGKTLLSDNASIEKQFKQIEDINKRREQMQMLLKWREELQNLEDEQIDVISDILCSEGRELIDSARIKVRLLIRKYGFNEVMTSAEIARDKYIFEQNLGLSYAFDKLGGICYNRKQKADITMNDER